MKNRQRVRGGMPAQIKRESKKKRAALMWGPTGPKLSPEGEAGTGGMFSIVVKKTL